MQTTEHTINDVIAELLRGTRFAWRGDEVVRSETTGLLAEAGGLRPDILVFEPYTAPVVIEAEVLPALSVEAEAVSRLRLRLAGSERPILSAIAVRLPTRLRETQGKALRAAVASASDIEFALYTVQNDASNLRYPEAGWLTGTILDLSLLVQSAALPPTVIERASNLLEVGVNSAAAMLEQYATSHPGAVAEIARQLQQQDSIQTRRMAMTIVANAFVFHASLTGGPGALNDVRSVDQLKNERLGSLKTAIADEWDKILQVNYWPIFDIAKRIMRCIPMPGSLDLMNQLARTAESLVEDNLMRSHDLTGTVFQRLIADRKFLAAFYTTPASAALLVGLAIGSDDMLGKGAWSDPDAVRALRIADFACGTGTLLSTAYQRISQLHEFHGGDSASLHPAMMERVLVGCDILPAAAHLTASMLSGAHPTVTYEGSAIFTQPYGRQQGGKIALGSIDLMEDMALLEGSQITAQALESKGSANKDTWRFVPHSSFDLVIMNPPFTRATNHEGRHHDVPNPVFAAFGSSAEEQKAMAAAARKLTKGTVAHGNAGEASTFLALAHYKLTFGGMLALVMPLTLLTGASWERARQLLANNYHELILISIAAVGRGAMSFSADTGMGECLVIGQRNGKKQKRAVFVVLNERPSHPYFGVVIAQQIRHLMSSREVRQLDEGPVGGSVLRFGGNIVGQAIEAPLPSSGSWKLARIVDLSLAQTAFQLATRGRIWLPTQLENDASPISMVPLHSIASVGPIDRDINGKYPDGSIRGPFELQEIQPNVEPTYPVLWGHNSKRETTLQFEADREGIPVRAQSAAERKYIDQKLRSVFASASHCHSNRDFQFNSQPVAMQFTSRKSIGGTAWLSVSLPEPDHEKTAVVWANTTLGLLMYWWHSSRQQAGRGRITKVSLQTLPILDITALRPDQLARAASIFDDTCQLPLKPLHELDTDENRKLIDRRFYGEVLGMPAQLLKDGGPLDILRTKLSREPSIRGAK